MSRRVDVAERLFEAVIVASVGVALAGLTWRVAGFSGSPSPAVIASAPARPPVSADVTTIAAAGLFGSAQQAGTAGAPQELQLRAILLADPKSASMVLISSNGGPVLPFAVGATLPNGAILASVERDRAILRTGSGDQVLAFPTVATAAASGNPAGGGGDIAAIRALIPQAAQGVPSTAPGAAAPIARAESPPVATSSLLEGLGATPNDGAGYRIGSSPSPQMQAAGLRAGDVIERVNGTAVGDPQRDRGLLDAALAAGTARLDVLRDGKRMALAIPLR